MGDDRRESASRADDRRLVPLLAPCRFRRPSRQGLPSIIPDRGELGQILRVLFSKPIPKQIAPTLVQGQRRGTCGCSIIVPGPCAGRARSGGMAGSRRTAAREKNGGRSISCDDGSDCASGVSCGRLCGGLYLGDDWPCVLLRAFEIVCVHDAPTTFMASLGGNHKL